MRRAPGEGGLIVEEEAPVCEGHYDDDRALVLGGPYYCNGSCVNRAEVELWFGPADAPFRFQGEMG